MAKTYTPVGWEDGTILKQPTVTINNVEYEITPAEVEGTTPVVAENLKHMDDAIKELYDEGTTSKDIVIGTEEDATEDTKLLIETDTLQTLGTEVVNSLDGNESYMAPSVQAVNNALKYSTKEQKVGTWEDENGNKMPLYRKVIDTTTASEINTAKTLDTIMNLKEIISKSISWKTTDNFTYLTDNPSEAPVLFIDTSNNIIESHQGDYFNKAKIKITLEYTKTTDIVIAIEEGVLSNEI